MSRTLVNTIAPKQYLAGTAYTNGTPSITGTGGFWTNTRGALLPYKTTNGIWRLIFNINGIFAGASNNNLFDVTISGVTFKNTTSYQQAISVADQATQSNPGYFSGYAVNNTGNLELIFSSSRSFNNRWNLSGDVELDSKPTWAD